MALRRSTDATRRREEAPARRCRETSRLEHLRKPRPKQLAERRARNRRHHVNFPRALERRDAGVEGVANRIGIACDGEMDDSAETLVGNGDDRGMVAGDRARDGVEAKKIDRLAADLREVSTPSEDTELAAFDFA